MGPAADEALVIDEVIYTESTTIPATAEQQLNRGGSTGTIDAVQRSESSNAVAQRTVRGAQGRFGVQWNKRGSKKHWKASRPRLNKLLLAGAALTQSVSSMSFYSNMQSVAAQIRSQNMVRLLRLPETR